MNLKEISKEELLAEIERRNKQEKQKKEKIKKDSEKEWAARLKEFEQQNAEELELLKPQWVTVGLDGVECKIKTRINFYEDFELEINEYYDSPFIFSGPNSKILNAAFLDSSDPVSLFLSSFPKLAQQEYRKKVKELEKKIKPLIKKISKLFENCPENIDLNDIEYIQEKNAQY